MNSLDELIKDTMDLHARQATSVDLPARVTRRLRRDSRLRAAGATLAVAGTLTASLWGVAALRDGTGRPQPAALVTTGECAGLRIVIGKPNPGESYRSPLDPVALRAGDNTITMGRQDYRWLEASGPCRDRLILEGPGPVVHGGGGDVDADGKSSPSGPFRNEGNVSSAIVFTNEATDGAGKFPIRLDAACASAPCPPPLATVHVFARGTVIYPGQVVTSSPTP
jgi:hypothetical protein